jgi:LEA14-like dessication related protein
VGFLTRHFKSLALLIVQEFGDTIFWTLKLSATRSPRFAPGCEMLTVVNDFAIAYVDAMVKKLTEIDIKMIAWFKVFTPHKFCSL